MTICESEIAYAPVTRWYGVTPSTCAQPLLANVAVNEGRLVATSAKQFHSLEQGVVHVCLLSFSPVSVCPASRLNIWAERTAVRLSRIAKHSPYFSMAGSKTRTTAQCSMQEKNISAPKSRFSEDTNL